MSQKKSPKTQSIQKNWGLLIPKNSSVRNPEDDSSFLPELFIGFILASWLPPLANIVYCSHGSQHVPINYETEHVISAQNLMKHFISLRTLWPSRLHIVWLLANLFDFIFCLTSLLKVHSIHPGLLHLENTKHDSTHILCLWSSSKRHFVWLTHFNQVATGMFTFSDIFVTPCPAYTKSHPLHHSSSPSTCFLSCFILFVYLFVASFVITEHMT